MQTPTRLATSLRPKEPLNIGVDSHPFLDLGSIEPQTPTGYLPASEIEIPETFAIYCIKLLLLAPGKFWHRILSSLISKSVIRGYFAGCLRSRRLWVRAPPGVLPHFSA
ncbi:hypothetical protein RB10741 [Rhodopirellula baltica SH 1]|uniref:Uncharacterized protein n=1 Tax=Rhodopirellula baltica (strain DSM 10527 / NCIMB 13988 / SH1) TaxID=243090 RepID=Q7UKB5_RHOBA|nr:hypothetical protein RB10741 [Rhodopirellula baltica SH 1]